MKLKRILFPTDLSPNTNTVMGHAVFHAEVYDAELHLFHNIDPNSEDCFETDPDTILAKLEESAKVQMAESLKQHKDQMFRIQDRTGKGPSTATAILDYIRENHIDLVVMGNHGHSGIKQFFLGSVAEEVVRKATCPILTIRAGEGIVVRPIRTILVPMDFSAQSRKALDQARRIAESHGAAIRLLHVIQNAFHPMGPEPGLQSVAEILPELEAGRRELLESLCKEAAGIEVQCVIEVGSAYQNITEHADRENVDMIVMGSHGYSGLAHLVLGSTAERVMRMAHCPVCIVKCTEEEKK